MNALLPTKTLPFAPVVSMRRVSALLGRDRKDLIRIAKIAGRYYDPFDVQRMPGGKWRHIDNPTQDLKDIQKRIHRAVLATYQFTPMLTGGIRGRSIKQNMAAHIGQPLVITLDIKECFPRIHDKRHVFPTLRELGFSEDVAALITKLTTFQHRLPQGAPSSSIIANLVLAPVHREIDRIARAFNLRWTMYVDDVAISGVRAREAVTPIVKALQASGFGISLRKLQIMPAHERQFITGGVVNRKLSVGRHYIDDVRRSILELADRNGDINEHEVSSVLGKIQHVTWVNPLHGAVLKRFAERTLPSPTAITARTVRGDFRRCDSFKRNHGG